MTHTRTAPPASENMIAIERVSRPEAIGRLRRRLQDFADRDHCLCDIVGRLGIFCGGFKRLSDAELNAKFDWITCRHHGMPRQTLEELAARYYEGRLEATGATFCCDLETKEHGGCDGWNQFTGADLEKFHLALVGSPIKVE